MKSEEDEDDDFNITQDEDLDESLHPLCRVSKLGSPNPGFQMRTLSRQAPLSPGEKNALLINLLKENRQLRLKNKALHQKMNFYEHVLFD